MRRATVLILLSLLSAPCLCAVEDFCRLELSFVDASTQEAIKGVELRLENPELGLRREIFSGPDGRALVFDLESGAWRAEAVPEGYEWFSLSQLRCAPGNLLRLQIRLRPTTADEGLSLGDAPEIDTNSTRTRVIFKLPDPSLPREGALTRADVPGVVGESEEPGSFIVRDLPIGEKAVPLRTWPRRRAGSGSFEFGLAGGAGGKLVRSRGRSTSLDLDLNPVFDWVFPLAEGHRLSFFATAGYSRVQERSGLAPDWEGPVLRNRSRRKLGRIALDLESPSGRRSAFALGGSFGLLDDDDEAATLYTVGEIPRFDSRRRSVDGFARVRWMLAENLELSGFLGWESRHWDLEPGSGDSISQDLSDEGVISSGFGRGVFLGEDAGGVPAIRDHEEEISASAALMYSPSARDMLDFRLDYSRRRRGFAPKASSPWVSARWRLQSGSGAFIDMLLPAEGGRGISSISGISLSEIRRISARISLRLGLEAEERDFDAGLGREGFHFDFAETLSPEIALIWDFAGEGKSRAWVSWERNRPRLAENIRLRLAGSMISTSNTESPDPGFDLPVPAIEVAAGLEPPRVDLFSLGMERELLAHLRMGAAVSFEGFRKGVAVLQPGDRSGFLLAAPQSGPLWDDALERDTTTASLWVRKTPSSGWQALLNVGWIGQSGTWDRNPVINLTDPDVEFSSDVLTRGSLNNARGPLDGDRRFFADLEGSWFRDSGFGLGARLFWRMGAPLSLRGAMDPGYGLDTRFVAPRGSAGRGPSTWQLDLNLLLPLGGRAPDLRVEILNLFFQQKPSEIDQRWSVWGSPADPGVSPEEQYTPGSFGEALRYQAPPELRVSLLWRW